MELLPCLLTGLQTADPQTLYQEYSVVRSLSSSLTRELGLTSEVGALKENIKKNRYKDILPYDQSRVVLSLLTSDSDSDYINASFIQGASSGCRYIACQGPLSSTVTDFWRMIWQHDIKVIVMACREVEMGKRKCQCYWAAANQTASFGPFTVTNQGETRPNEDLVVRTLSVSFQQTVLSVVQYQFLSWPDHDVPYETSGLLDLLEGVRRRRGADTSPLLIHCSAGCGRTGVICALDYIHDLLVTKQISADFSIRKVVLEIRRQRPSAVQTKEQYRFIFTAAACMLERFLQPAGRRLSYKLGEMKEPEKEISTGTSSFNRLSQQIDMNDTYAVVNKRKQPHPPPTSPAYPNVAPPTSNSGSRSLPLFHHYDNDLAGAAMAAAPIYSIVRPRVKPLSPQHSATPIYDIAAPANHKPGEELGYHLVSAEALSPDDDDDDDYEDMSQSFSDTPTFCSPGSIGFNCRVQKPKGPRDPPAEWSRLER